MSDQILRTTDYSKWLGDFVRTIDSPSSVGFELNAVALRQKKTTKELVELFIEALVSSDDVPTLTKALNEWIQSEFQALLAYQALISVNTALANGVLHELIANNLFYSEAIPFDASSDQTRPRLITMSFEKETYSPTVRMCYRLAHFTEEEWFALDDATAVMLLEKYSLIPNVEILSRVIVPTSLKPNSWGPYTTDGSSAFQLENRGSEVKHKLYEIDPFRIHQAMEETASLLEETHSFHGHVVTELPRQYRSFQEFLIWYKYTSDYLYLRGLEEGLHNTELTRIPIFPEDAEPMDALIGGVQNKLGLQAKTLPTRLEEIGDQNAKRNGIGLRSGSIYGKSSDPQYIKVGLELRDPTRDMGTWREYMGAIASGLASRIWERYTKHASVSLPRIGQRDVQGIEIIKAIFGEKFYKLILKSEPQVVLPFFQFEHYYYFDFHAQNMIRPSKDQVSLMKKAREEYREELRSLALELEDFSARDESVDPDVIRYIVRMALTQWARTTHISELYRGALK